MCSSSVNSIDYSASEILSLNDKYNIYKCRKCKQRILHPQLSNNELDKLYSGSYFDNSENINFSKYSINKAASDYNADVSTRINKFKLTIKKLRKINPNGKFILDVGAAKGDFVKLARDSGLHADGIEYSKYAIDKARIKNNVKLERLLLNEVDKKYYYDFIHLNHVFEHFNNPNNELKQIERLLKKEGILYIEIPFQFHFVERILFKFFKPKMNFSIHSIHHPYMYTPNTLTKILSNNGFSVIKLSTYDFKRYNKNSFLGLLKNLIWFLLSLINVGNYIEVYAKKK